jgi:hypothetical protein
MPRLLDYLAPLYVWLYALDPMLPQELFVSLVFFTVLLLRKLAPNQWEAFANLIHVKADDTAWWQLELRALWQMLPAAIIGTIYGVLGTGAELWPTLKLSLLSLVAPFVHRIAKRYEGKVGPLKGSGGPGGGASILGRGDGTTGVPAEITTGVEGDVLRRGGSIQKVEIVVTSNQHPSRIARAVIGELSRRAPVVLAILALIGCSPSQWEAQRAVANDVAVVSENTIEPMLKAADESTAAAVVVAAPTEGEAQTRLSIHHEKWKVVWAAWEGFRAAHSAWQDVIDAKGDPLPSLIATRTAFCRLRATAEPLGVKLPHLPLGDCS